MKPIIKKLTAGLLAVLFCLNLLGLSACGGGSSGTGGITNTDSVTFSGVLRSSTGGVLANVDVTVAETGESTLTDNKGAFSLVSEVEDGQNSEVFFDGEQINTSLLVDEFPDDTNTAIIDVTIDRGSNTIASASVNFEKRELVNNPSNRDFAPGNRENKEKVCIALFDPVCGTNGHTYGNSCEAARAGVEVGHSGECTATILPTPADPTDDDLVCIALFDPVCGTDGQTYGNSCEAERDGVEVDHPGECTATILPTPADPTDDDLVCIALFDPVCGTDGQTYSNSCEAKRAWVEVGHPGECAD